MLGSVSPQMFEEYEVEYVKPLLEQFGLVYYGCCEPLHNRIDYIRKIKNVRKISMSPWADIRAGAEHIHGDYVISRKPNPAYLAAASFDPELVRRELQETCRAAKGERMYLRADFERCQHGAVPSRAAGAVAQDCSRGCR